MSKSERWFHHWKVTRKKGKLRFVFFNGILPSIIINLIGYFLGYKYYKKQFSFEFFYDMNFLYVYVISLLFFCILGVFLGSLEWSHNEEKYTEHLINQRRVNILNNFSKNKEEE